MATRSGRGVMISRTSVSPKWTIERSRRASSSLASSAAVSTASGVALAPRSVSSSVWAPSASRRRTRPSSASVSGSSGLETMRNDGSRNSGDDPRVGADDQLRHEVLADDDEAEDHHRQHEQAAPRADPEQHGRELDRDDQDDAEQDPRRDEQQARLVQVPRQRVVGVGSLGAQALRQPHQRREGGLNGADVDPGAAEEEQQERDHTLHVWAGPRSISPAGKPPCRLSRRSIRAMRPESRS